MGVVVDGVRLEDRLELRRRLVEAARAEVGAAQRLADGRLLRRHPGRLRERHRRLREVARLEQRHAALVERVEIVRLGFRHASECRPERKASTRSRIASATSAFDASGTACSAAASTIVTSFSVESKPISSRETSLKTIASRPFRSSFSRARVIASAPCSAANPTSVCSSVRLAASPARTSSVAVRRSSIAVAAGAGQLALARLLGREVGDGGGHQQHVATGNSSPTAAASSAVVSTSMRRTPGGSASADVRRDER